MTIYDVFKYFHTHNQRISMTILFYLFPQTLLDTIPEEFEDYSDIAQNLGSIIGMLLEMDSDYYLPLLNDYVNWSEIELLQWGNKDDGSLLNYIKYFSL